MHFTQQIFIRKDYLRHRRTKGSFNTLFNGTKIENSDRKANIFSIQLSKHLSKTKKLKLKKLFKEISRSPPKTEHTNNTWIQNLDITANDKEITLRNQDLHEGIIEAAINVIQRQFPILVIQSPSLYFAAGFEYCPKEAIQTICNTAHYWIQLSSFNEDVKISDSLKTVPTIGNVQQIK